ncbi:MAG: phosphate ABC transporter permease subunit PstC [Lentisphaerae bacterium]|nr:phosphate ABC transporter permease subunit PstC [Lentisphaerota bacterium]
MAGNRDNLETGKDRRRSPSLLLTSAARRRQKLLELVGKGLLLSVTSVSVLAVFFIFYFIARDALPFFRLEGFREFFTSTRWYPSSHEPEFGALAMFYGSGIVTLGAALVAVPLGVAAAVCLSDVLPFGARQVVKPVIEMLAAIPSVAYGFFALVVLAPLMQESGGAVMRVLLWVAGGPVAVLAVLVASDVVAGAAGEELRKPVRLIAGVLLCAGAFLLLSRIGAQVGAMKIASGTNALNVSVILGIMALPTVVSVSEDALQAVGREIREGSYALGATRAETVVKAVLPAASGGILAAVILGIMRAVGETMVVWMASGNASQIPSPWWRMTEPVRTLTATIAGDMGEADHVTGSSRYHVLFAMALCLLVISFASNLCSEMMLRRARRKRGG